MSGFVAPVALPAGASSWAVTDYRPLTLTSGPAGADGIAQAVGEQLDLDELWLIDRAVVSCTSSTETKFRLYDGAVASVGALRSGTRTGTFDEGDYPAGVLIQQGSQVLGVWSGCSVGAVGTLNLQVRVLRPVTG